MSKSVEIQSQDLTKRYTLGEEIFNSVSHGAGGLLSIAGTAVLIVLAAIYSNAWGVVSSAIFGASLIILYTMSTLYHAITNPKAKKFFRIMDHNTIFFLIAGTYTPITLVPLRGAFGWVLFGIVWGAAILGIVLNSIDLEKFRKPSVVCSIAMGNEAEEESTAEEIRGENDETNTCLFAGGNRRTWIEISFSYKTGNADYIKR